LNKPVISVTDGSTIAKVLDVLVDPNALQVAAAVTSKGGGPLKRGREMDVIPADEVQVWGKDAVLVKRPDVIVKDSELPGRESWLSVSSQLKGRDVIGNDGTRLGQLNDVVIDVDGQFVSYDLVQPFVYGGDPAQKMKQIPAGATSVLGQDVLIMVMDQVEQALPVEEPPQVEDLTVEEDLPQAEVLAVEEDQPQVEEMPGFEEDQPESDDAPGQF
jgi:sporulation protein YlmC with PRC-barrel domain